MRKNNLLQRENKKFSSHNPTIGNIDKIDSIKVRYLNTSFINTVCNNYDIIGTRVLAFS